MKYEKSLERLIEESMKEEPPTRYEERALYWKMQNGVEGAKDELVTRNMRFVMHLAKGFTGHGVDLGGLRHNEKKTMCRRQMDTASRDEVQRVCRLVHQERTQGASVHKQWRRGPAQNQLQPLKSKSLPA